MYALLDHENPPPGIPGRTKFQNINCCSQRRNKNNLPRENIQQKTILKNNHNLVYLDGKILWELTDKPTKILTLLFSKDVLY